MYMRVTSWILKHIFIVETVHMHVVSLIPNNKAEKKMKRMLKRARSGNVKIHTKMDILDDTHGHICIIVYIFYYIHVENIYFLR